MLQVFKKILSFLMRLFCYIYNYVILKNNHVSFGQGLVINGFIYINNKGTIDIGQNVKINSGAQFNPIGGQTRTRLIVYPGATLSIGNDVGISNSSIVSQTEILIDDGAMIGASCNIFDTDFHSLDDQVRGTKDDKGKTKPIYIGKKTFIGAHSIILKGVSTLDKSIIGAGSVIRQKATDD
jgi:acetyltransferase-like isoleucine patch superfamily enzyme